MENDLEGYSMLFSLSTERIKQTWFDLCINMVFLVVTESTHGLVYS
jgi:hypothetical protein